MEGGGQNNENAIQNGGKKRRRKSCFTESVSEVSFLIMCSPQFDDNLLRKRHRADIFCSFNHSFHLASEMEQIQGDGTRPTDARRVGAQA